MASLQLQILRRLRLSGTLVPLYLIAMRILILFLAGILGMAASSLLAQDRDRHLEEFFQAYLDRYFEQQPLAATRLGDHRFDDRLDDLSPDAREQWVALTRQTLADLPHEVEFERLSIEGQLDYRILEHDLQHSLWLHANTRPFEQDPRVYSGYISDGVFLLLTQSTLPPSTNVANAIVRMRQIPRVVASAQLNLKQPLRQHLETAILQNRGALAFYETDLFLLAGQTPQIGALRQAAAQVIICLRGYQEFLESLRGSATEEWRLGRQRFGEKLELELNAGLSADEVLADAEREYDRVQNQMYVIARQLWSRYFPVEALPPDDAEGRRTTVRKVLAKVGQDHGEAENLVRDVREIVVAVKTFIGTRSVLPLPEPDRCEIIEMPEFQRGNSTAYMNAPPPLDPGAVGQYAVSPPPADWDAQRVKSYLEEYNRHMLHILTIHEAYPGHYVQLEYANQNPSLIRRVLQSGVYIEGWAVYTEQTMLDQGYGDGDLALRLTQLKFYLRAVVNAILDHRMHCQDMTDDEALRLLMEGAYQSEGEARLKVIRSKQSSCQLSTYFVGRMAMYRLRQQMQRELGDRFNLSDYHVAILEPGPIPVRHLPETVRRQLREDRSP